MLKVEDKKEGYLIHENEGEYIVCKIIKICPTEELAIEKLVECLEK